MGLDNFYFYLNKELNVLFFSFFLNCLIFIYPNLGIREKQRKFTLKCEISFVFG